MPVQIIAFLAFAVGFALGVFFFHSCVHHEINRLQKAEVERDKLREIWRNHVLRGDQHGFTMVEMLVAVAIFGIVATITIPNMAYSIQRQRQVKTMSEIERIHDAIADYWKDNGTVPPSNADKTADALSVMNGHQILGVRTHDEWGTKLYYQRLGPDAYLLKSFGSNKIYDGDDDPKCFENDIVITQAGWLQSPAGSQEYCQ